MIGSFLTRGLVMVFGYAYPAYECFKSVEKNKPDIDQLRFWCQYWVPMYSEAKLAFYIYLWYPKTQGTTYVYDSFFKPYISKHEPDIDRNLMELRTRAGDVFVLYWQRAASYGQTRIFDILQYVASQSTPKPRPPQPPQNGRPRPPAPNRQGPPATPPETKEPPPPATTTSSSSPSDSTPHQLDDPQVPPTTSSAAVLKAQKSILSQGLVVTAKPETSNEVEMTETEPSGSSNSNPSVKEIMMEEAVRVHTRARSRKSSVTSASVQ